MATQTVTECLNMATDSVNLINGVKAGSWNVEGMTQAEINTMVQRNVDHLEVILAYDGSKKTDCTNAITTGKAYITSNS